MDPFKFIKENGKCCISEKPLKDSKHIHWVQLQMPATWKFPVWGNVLINVSNMAVAYVHDDCVKNGVVTGEIKFAVELNNGELIYHEYKPPVLRSCRVCGCSDHDACFHPDHGNCSWVEEDLCSHCMNWPGESIRFSQMEMYQ